jgi:hypothetical protein
MLIVKANQFELLNKNLRIKLILKLERSIKDEHVETYLKLSSEEWKKWINKKINECIEYNILKENELEEYLEISLRYPAMEIMPKKPWIEDLLRNDSRTVEDRFTILVEKLIFDED